MNFEFIQELVRQRDRAQELRAQAEQAASRAISRRHNMLTLMSDRATQLRKVGMLSASDALVGLIGELERMGGER